ncbi:MAG: hypothetical protein HYU28_06430 [Actinobacteria bacterium]|nr:hypothetical protein [Actinomycetota bacterium]
MPAALTEEGAGSRALAGWAWAAVAFVFLAVGLEVVGGQYANSRVPGAAEWLVPLAWPQAARVVWWLIVASAAVAFRYAERQAGIRRHPIIIGASVIPFAVFAVGVALGAGFSTWH